MSSVFYFREYENKLVKTILFRLSLTVCLAAKKRCVALIIYCDVSWNNKPDRKIDQEFAKLIRQAGEFIIYENPVELPREFPTSVGMENFHSGKITR